MKTIAAIHAIPHEHARSERVSRLVIAGVVVSPFDMQTLAQLNSLADKINAAIQRQLNGSTPDEIRVGSIVAYSMSAGGGDRTGTVLAVIEPGRIPHGWGKRPAREILSYHISDRTADGVWPPPERVRLIAQP